MELVSIVIPCYNSEETVRRAIESALCQHYHNKEIVVINDGSTDASHEVIQEYIGEIRYLLTTNQGACAARNIGLQMSSGKYVQFLDADDEIYPEKIAHQIERLRNSHSMVAFLAAGALKIDLDGKADTVIPSVGDPWISLIRGGGRLGQTSANLWIRKSLVAVGGWNEKLAAGQEVDLMARLLDSGFEYLSDREPLTTIYARRNSITFSQKHLVCNPETWVSRVKVRMEIRKMLELRRAFNNGRKDEYLRALISMRRYFGVQDIDMANYWFEKATEGLKFSYKRKRFLERMIFNLFGVNTLQTLRAMYRRN